MAKDAQVRRRVLVVDDDPNVGRTTALALADDFDCTVVGGGREALAVLDRGERFDVILCDLLMPELSGIDLYDEVLRRWPALAPRMLFVSGGATTPESSAFVDQHAAAFLIKPYTLASLLERLRAHAG